QYGQGREEGRPADPARTRIERSDVHDRLDSTRAMRANPVTGAGTNRSVGPRATPPSAPTTRGPPVHVSRAVQWSGLVPCEWARRRPAADAGGLSPWHVRSRRAGR